MVSLFALFAILTTTQINNAQSVEEYDVIIMGAGMTGISAGNTLHSAGMDNFIILEAQDYIGGRTRTVNFGTGTNQRGVSIGASWISGSCYDIPNPSFECWYHGNRPTEINPMLTYALNNDYSFNRTDIHEWNSIPWFLDGPGVTPPIFVDIEYAKWHDINLGCMRNIYNAIWDGNRADISYEQGLIECGWSGIHDTNNINITIQWIEYNLEMAYNIGTYSLAMGAGPLYSYQIYGNQDLFITDTRGYQGITEDLAGNIPSDNIRLNSPVTEIEYDTDDGVTVYTDDTVYHAKYGLVTFSMGVLKSNPPIIEFDPPLPSWKQEAIDNTLFAHYAAVYIEWPNRFWSEQHPEINDNNIVVMSDARYGYLPWFLNLDHESLMPGSLMWRFDITEELALKFQQQSNEATVNELINDKFSLYFDSDTIPQPLSVLVGNMSINEYVQGAYTAYPIGYDWYQTVGDLQHTIDQVLYFGGEHTNLDDSGYVHTAYFEGIRAGSQILNCLGYPSSGYQCQGPYDPIKQQNTSKVLKKRRKNYK